MRSARSSSANRRPCSRVGQSVRELGSGPPRVERHDDRADRLGRPERDRPTRDSCASRSRRGRPAARPARRSQRATARTIAVRVGEGDPLVVVDEVDVVGERRAQVPDRAERRRRVHEHLGRHASDVDGLDLEHSPRSVHDGNLAFVTGVSSRAWRRLEPSSNAAASIGLDASTSIHLLLLAWRLSAAMGTPSSSCSSSPTRCGGDSWTSSVGAIDVSASSASWSASPRAWCRITFASCGPEGLVSARQSAADGRDTYYQGNIARFAELLRTTGTALHPAVRLTCLEVDVPAAGEVESHACCSCAPGTRLVLRWPRRCWNIGPTAPSWLAAPAVTPSRCIRTRCG